MFESVQRRIQKRVQEQHYIMTLPSEQEMVDDNLTIWDIQNAILSGDIVEGRQDPATSEWSYCIRGATMDGATIEVLVRLGVTGKVII